MTDEYDGDKPIKERRGHPRHAIKQDVRVEADGEVVKGEASNLSLTGVAINALVPMSTEQFVNLHLEKIGDLSGDVVRQTDDGFAVEFEKVDDNGSVLEDKLRKLMGTEQPKDNPTVDEVDDERARMEAHLMSMLSDDD